MWCYAAICCRCLVADSRSACVSLPVSLAPNVDQHADHLSRTQPSSERSSSFQSKLGILDNRLQDLDTRFVYCSYWYAQSLYLNTPVISIVNFNILIQNKQKYRMLLMVIRQIEVNGVTSTLSMMPCDDGCKKGILVCVIIFSVRQCSNADGQY